MKKLLIFLFSGNLYAADCELTWDANPTEEKITHYTVYESDNELIQVNDTKHTMTCAAGSYSVTATSEYGLESNKSNPVIIVNPTVPKSIIINIVIN